MTEWMYYAAFFSIGGSVEHPALILRKREGDHDAFAQRLDRSGQWMHSSILVDVARLNSDFDVEPISSERAAFLSQEWGLG